MDLDINTKWNQSEIATYQEAQERVMPYVDIVGGKYKLTISTGASVGVSDRLFNAIAATVAQANDKIIKQELFLIDDLLLSEEDIDIFAPLTKGGTEAVNGVETEFKSSWWGWTKKRKLTQKEAEAYSQQMHGESSAMSTLALFLAFGTMYNSYYNSYATVWGYAWSRKFGTVGSKVYDAAQYGGVTITETYNYGGQYGGTTTNTIHDSKGNYVTGYSY